MALTEKALAKQVDRLKALPLREGQDWGTLRKELYETLWRISSDDEHAEQIIQRAIDSKPADKPQYRPTPGDIIIYGAQLCTDRQEENEIKPTVCNSCGDSGFRQVVRVIHGREYSFAEKCEHRKGTE